METVSIIVPVFNGEGYLSACLESLLSQSFRDFRVYLIDDGSTDQTPLIGQHYSAWDGRIQYIRQENRGVSAARNRGLELAGGKYVTFCDGDDFWESNHLETMVQAVEATGADMVSSNYSLVDAQGKFLRRTYFPAEVRDIDTPQKKINYIQDVLNWRTGWVVWARLFRRDAIGDLRFCEEVGFGEDLLFALEAALRCRRVASISEGGCCYRQHERSAMAGVKEKPMLAQRGLGAYWLWQRLPELGPARDGIAWGILKPGLEAVPAAQLHRALQVLPQRNWIRDLARRVDTPLARFCVHENVLRYRIEKKLDV